MSGNESLSVSPWTDVEAEHAADRIRELGRQIVTDVVNVGRILIEAKDRLPHGEFLPWLERSFRWTERTAQNFMSVAERIGEKAKYVSHLPLTTVYRLAAPGTPDGYRQSMLTRLEGGEAVSDNEIKSQLKQLRRMADDKRREEKSLKGKSPKSVKRIKDRNEKQRQREEQEEKELQLKGEAQKAARSSAVALLMEVLEEDDLASFIGLIEIAGTLHRADFV